jgi:hypothetical protein
MATDGRMDGRTNRRTNGQIFAQYSGRSSHSLKGVQVFSRIKSFVDKPDGPSQCLNHSIQPSNIDTNTNPSNQYEMRREDLKKFAILSRVNAEYNYLCQLTLKL